MAKLVKKHKKILSAMFNKATNTFGTYLWGQNFVIKPISYHWSLYIPLKTSENLWFSVVCRGYRKRSLV